MLPRVSVIIPTFNSEDTICNAVESVLTQTYHPHEIIVVDDGSTDATIKVLRPYQDKIRYIFQPNQERSSARNHGLRMAEGDFIAFVDSDDWWLPNKLHKQIDLFRTNPKLGMVYSQAYVVNNTGKRLALTGVAGTQNDQEEFYCELLTGNLIPSPTPLIRRNILLAVGGFDESLCQGEDWDCWLRVGQISSIGFICEPMAFYRISNGIALLKRMLQHSGANANVTIIKKAIQRGGCPKEIYEKALGLAHFKGALIEAGCNQIEAARLRLDMVKNQFPNFFVQTQNILLDNAANLAAQVCLGEADAGLGISFLNKVYEALPDGIFPSSIRKKMIANLYIVRFYQASQMGNLASMIRTIPSIALNDASWLRNRGIWSTFTRSILHSFPQKEASLM